MSDSTIIAYIKKNSTLIAVVLMAAFAYYILISAGAVATIKEAVQKENPGRNRLLEITDDNKYVFFLTDNNQINAASVIKNAFGWKLGSITRGSDNTISIIPANSALAGFSNHAGKLLYGVINDSRIQSIEVNDRFAKIIPLKNYSHRLWYVVSDSLKANNQVAAYDKNQNIVEPAASVLSKLKEYRLSNYNIKMNLPVSTGVTEDYLGNEELLFSSYLSDETLQFRGYIQLWQLADLEKFLQDSKATSIFNFTSYNRQKTSVNTYAGYLVNWTASGQNQKVISGKEYFFVKNNSKQVLRVSFFADADHFPKQLEQTAKTMISSIIWR